MTRSKINLSDALATADITFREVLERLGKNGLQIVLVADADGRLLGTLTDGDVRRAILTTAPMDRPASEFMNPHPITSGPDVDQATLLRVLQKNAIRHLPIIDHDRKVVDLVRIEDLIPSQSARDNVTVILAGGMGSRLKPLTDQTPKSLLPIGGRPILEIIFGQLAESGFSRFYLAVNHLAHAVKSRFGDGSSLGVEINYLEEKSPLGTAGPLGLIEEKLSKPAIVMNSDILTKIDYAGLVDHHVSLRSKATVAMREIEISVPYGVLNLKDDKIIGVTEKPVHKYFVNAGIYVLEPDVIADIPRDTAMDMPDLLNRLTTRGDIVSGYPVHEYWIDIGRLEDLHRATADYSTIFG